MAAQGAILPVQTFSSHEDLLFKLGELCVLSRSHPP